METIFLDSKIGTHKVFHVDAAKKGKGYHIWWHPHNFEEFK